jgi:hypothetical protein
MIGLNYGLVVSNRDAQAMRGMTARLGKGRRCPPLHPPTKGAFKLPVEPMTKAAFLPLGTLTRGFALWTNDQRAFVPFGNQT